MEKSYVAVIDSGIGGVSVLKELIRLMPNERYIYLGDNKNAPYGNRTENDLFSLSMANIDLLKKYNLKAIVLGCNTLSVCLRDKIESYSGVKTFGVYPPIERAVISGEETLLLSTVRTAKTLSKNTLGINAVGLVNLAREIELNAFRLNNVNFAKCLLNSDNVQYGCVNLKKGHYKSVILGCTHYNFIKNKIFDHLKPQKIISGEFYTAKSVKSFLEQSKSLEKICRFELLFLGEFAKTNQKFYELSGY